jgi:hypothetical protein
MHKFAHPIDANRYALPSAAFRDPEPPKHHPLPPPGDGHAVF